MDLPVIYEALEAHLSRLWEWTGYGPKDHDDEDDRFDPVAGDTIDELVNWQIEQGKQARR